eukprot:3592187-Karenia_brevis.AAC.1
MVDARPLIQRDQLQLSHLGSREGGQWQRVAPMLCEMVSARLLLQRDQLQRGHFGRREGGQWLIVM